MEDKQKRDRTEEQTGKRVCSPKAVWKNNGKGGHRTTWKADHSRAAGKEEHKMLRRKISRKGRSWWKKTILETRKRKRTWTTNTMCDKTCSNGHNV